MKESIAAALLSYLLLLQGCLLSDEVSFLQQLFLVLLKLFLPLKTQKLTSVTPQQQHLRRERHTVAHHRVVQPEIFHQTLSSAQRLVRV